MLVTQSSLAHVCKLNSTLGAGIHEPITALRVKFSCGDDFSQFLHIGWFDIDDVEALVLNVEIPKVDSEVITANECLTIAVDRDAVDMIGMGIGVGATRYRCYDCIVVRHARQFELLCIFELRWDGCPSTARACGRYLSS